MKVANGQSPVVRDVLMNNRFYVAMSQSSEAFEDALHVLVLEMFVGSEFDPRKQQLLLGILTILYRIVMLPQPPSHVRNGLADLEVRIAAES